MDISEKVTVTHEMKRGNYAVSTSNRVGDDGDSLEPSSSAITSDDFRYAPGFNTRQARESFIHTETVYLQREGTRMCVEYCVQRESIQRGLTQQIEWSTWSMAITLGKTRVVTTQTNTGSTRVCATSL